jgi:hypothetical protein
MPGWRARIGTGRWSSKTEPGDQAPGSIRGVQLGLQFAIPNLTKRIDVGSAEEVSETSEGCS